MSDDRPIEDFDGTENPSPGAESAVTPPPTAPLPIPKCGARGLANAYLFVPQDDITARESAGAMEMVMFGFAGMIGASPPQLVDILYANLPEAAKRHWQVVEIKQPPAVITPENQPKGLFLPESVARTGHNNGRPIVGKAQRRRR